MKMIQELIGHKLTEPQSKDAIHIAVAPVTASETLYPGQQVGFLHGIESDLVCATSPATPALGIVDPFLTEAVAEGEKFFMFLLPNTVTGMRHEWQHPAFVATGASVPDPVNSLDDARLQIAIGNLTRIATTLDLSFDELIEVARSYLQEDEMWYGDTSDVYDIDYRSFWEDWGRVTGEPIARGFDDCPFSCSC